MYTTAFLLASIICVVCTSGYPAIRSLGTISIGSPAFLEVSTTLPDSELALVVSSFGVNPLKAHGVYVIPDIASKYEHPNTINATRLSAEGWPNQVSSVPSNVFNGQKVLAIPDGFLVPGFTTGSISLLANPNPNNVTNNPPFKISTDLTGYFYHMLVWRDINGDGREDILTARGTKPIIGTAGGNLLWYEQPAKDPLTSIWTPHQIINGPDVHFQLFDINNDGNEELVAAQFFTPGLVLYYKPKGTLWTNTSAIKSVVIDATLGPMFEISFSDINNDGKVDILATNHVNNENSGVYAFEIPNDWATGTWTKHIIFRGIKTIQVGGASPGVAVAFQPTTKSNGRNTNKHNNNNNNIQNEKPLIALSGDGAEAAYLISPVSQDPQDWEYSVQTIYSGKSTTGELIVYDIDGDGFSEVFVPLYDADQIQVFTFKN